jgi:hypothetical protein
MSGVIRFIEREGLAENFLTRYAHLPPLNFSCEAMHTMLVVMTDGNPVIKFLEPCWFFKHGNKGGTTVMLIIITRPFLGGEFFVF